MKPLIALMLLLSACSSLAQDQLLGGMAENFHGYANGSDGSPIWHVVKGDWHVRDGAYEQRSAEYDCAAMLEGAYMEGSFELEADFEHLEGDPGVGVIFASQRFDDISCAEMARFDGGTTFLAGYFQNGEFTGTASTKSALLLPGARHTLLLRVDGKSETWSILLDGRPIFDRPLPLRYAGGYVGLQSSAGQVRFTRVAHRITDRGSRAGTGWTSRIAATPTGEFLLPNARTGRIVVDSGAGARSFGGASRSGGPLHEPAAAAALDARRIVVVDRAQGRIHLFDKSGVWHSSAGWKGKARGTLDDPAAVAVDAALRIFVAERKNNRVQVFDDSLKSIAEFGNDRLKSPSDIALQGENLFVLNTGLSQVEWYIWNGSRATWKQSISYGGGEAHGLAAWRDRIFISVVNEVRSYSLEGALLATLRGRSVGSIFPQGLAIDASGRLAIADFVGGRIVLTDTKLTDPVPEARFFAHDSSSAEIRWETPFPTVGRLALTLQDGSVREFREDAPATRHAVALRDLRPGTTYHYRILSALETRHETSPRSGRYSFTTPSGPKTMQYARVKMAALLFTNVADEKTPSSPAGAAQAPVAASEVARIVDQIRDGVRFYWMQSGMRFFIDVDFLVINDALKRGDVYGSEWWYPPKEEALGRSLAANGRDIGDYGSFLYLTCTQSYDSALGKLALAGKGGGFTNGVGTGKGYGISWWDLTRKDQNAGNNWLMVHEFNHQLDDIFMASGYPEYWFNHISPTIGTAAAFGEHFDANAHILRMVPHAEWTDLRYTTLETARDADGDGIPDNAPALPMDEVRLGSDSTRVDTDGDGLDDLAELRSSNWITEGWGETYGGAKFFPNLAKRDTDGDGVPDASDPYPLYPAAPRITMLGTNGIGGSEYFLGVLDDSLANASFRGFWTDRGLHVRFNLDRPRVLKVMLDVGGDGWFLGRGNYLLVVTPQGDSAASVSAQIFNATDPSNWPFMDKGLAGNLGVTCSLLQMSGGRVEGLLTIPRNELLGLTLRPGDAIGLLLGVQATFGAEGMKRYVDLWEPNRFMNFRLDK